MAAARKGFRQPPFPPADRAAMPGSGRFVRTRTACDIKERSVMGMHDVEAGERAAGMAALLAALLRDEPRGEWLGRLAADEVFAELPYAQEREDAEAGRVLVEAWLATCDEAALEAARSDYMACSWARARRLRRRGSRCAATRTRRWCSRRKRSRYGRPIGNWAFR